VTHHQASGDLPMSLAKGRKEKKVQGKHERMVKAESPVNQSTGVNLCPGRIKDLREGRFFCNQRRVRKTGHLRRKKEEKRGRKEKESRDGGGFTNETVWGVTQPGFAMGGSRV